MIKISVSEKCTGCGICVKKCPTRVLKLENRKSVVEKLEDCMVCKYCEVVCPEKGIKVTEE